MVLGELADLWLYGNTTFPCSMRLGARRCVADHKRAYWEQRIDGERELQDHILT